MHDRCSLIESARSKQGAARKYLEMEKKRSMTRPGENHSNTQQATSQLGSIIFFKHSRLLLLESYKYKLIASASALQSQPIHTANHLSGWDASTAGSREKKEKEKSELYFETRLFGRLVLLPPPSRARRVILPFSFSVWTCSISWKQQEDDRKVVKAGLVLQTIKWQLRVIEVNIFLPPCGPGGTSYPCSPSFSFFYYYDLILHSYLFGVLFVEKKIIGQQDIRFWFAFFQDFLRSCTFELSEVKAITTLTESWRGRVSLEIYCRWTFGLGCGH